MKLYRDRRTGKTKTILMPRGQLWTGPIATTACADIDWRMCLRDPGFWQVVVVFILLAPIAFFWRDAK